MKRLFFFNLALIFIVMPLSLFNGRTNNNGSIDGTGFQSHADRENSSYQTDSNCNIFVNQVNHGRPSLKNRKATTYESDINESEYSIESLNLSNFQIAINAKSAAPENIDFIATDSIILGPISIVIIMDYSTSITDFTEARAAMETAVIGFIDLMYPKDQAEIIKFNTGIRYLQPFTNDGSLLTAAVIYPEDVVGGYTYFYDTLYTALLENAAIQKFDPSFNGRNHGRLTLLSELNGISDSVNTTISYTICP